MTSSLIWSKDRSVSGCGLMELGIPPGQCWTERGMARMCDNSVCRRRFQNEGCDHSINGFYVDEKVVVLVATLLMETRGVEGTSGKIISWSRESLTKDAPNYCVDWDERKLGQWLASWRRSRSRESLHLFERKKKTKLRKCSYTHKIQTKKRVVHISWPSGENCGHIGAGLLSLYTVAVQKYLEHNTSRIYRFPHRLPTAGTHDLEHTVGFGRLALKYSLLC